MPPIMTIQDIAKELWTMDKFQREINEWLAEYGYAQSNEEGE